MVKGGHTRQIACKEREIEGLRSENISEKASERIAIIEAEIALLHQLQDGQLIDSAPNLMQSVLDRNARLIEDNVRLERQLAGNPVPPAKQIQDLSTANKILITANESLTATNKTLAWDKAGLESQLLDAVKEVSTLILQCQYQTNHVESATAKAEDSVTSQEWFWKVWNETKSAGVKATKVEAENKKVENENKTLAHKVVILNNALGAVNKELSSHGFANATIGLPGNIQTTKEGKTFDLNFSHRPLKHDQDDADDSPAPAVKAFKFDNVAIDQFKLEMLFYDTAKNEFISKGSAPVSISKNDTLAKVTQLCESKLPALPDGQELRTIAKTESSVHEGSYREVTHNEYARWTESLKMCDRELSCRVFVFPKAQEQQAKATVRSFN